MKNWKDYFPFAEPRIEQIAAINFVLEQLYDADKNVIVLDLGLGIGKSAIATTVARYVCDHPFDGLDEELFENGSYILTSQKILQEQYMKDFACEPNNMHNLISSSNHDCHGRPGSKCSASLRVYKALGDRFPPGPRNVCRKMCGYKKQKQAFIKAQLGVTNYAYFMSETAYAGHLKPRRLIVVDEAHNVTLQVSKHVELRITQNFCESVLNIEFLQSSNTNEIYKWICSTYEPAIAKYISKLVVDIEKAKDEKKLLQYSDRLELLDKHICKIHRMQQIWEPSNWIINIQDDGTVYEFKPIDVSSWVEESLLKFGAKKILMSATILNKDYYFKTLGLDPSKTAYLSLESPFKSENKPIIYAPVGKMSYSHIEKNIDKMVDVIAEIINMHKDEKGLCHAANFRITEAIGTKIKNRRMLVQQRGVNREEIYKQHVKLKTPTVLVSPSMMEGVDLKDDLSRFQIFCKIPYPSLADQLIKKKLEKDPLFYPYVTAQTIIQASGRSIRNESDWAITYILDECAEEFFRKYAFLFPKAFIDSIVDLNGKQIFKKQ